MQYVNSQAQDGLQIPCILIIHCGYILEYPRILLRAMDTCSGESTIKIDFVPFLKRSTLKGNNSLPF